MNPASAFDQPKTNCPVTILVRLEETWIAHLIQRDEWVVPVGEQYQLHHLQFKIGEGSLILVAEIVGKPGSFVEVRGKPFWDIPAQKLIVNDLQFETRTRNILIKSAAWFASTFMQEKIDKRIEAYTRNLFLHHLERITSWAIEIPVSGNGVAIAKISSLWINRMEFQTGVIHIEVTLNGQWEMNLK